MGNEIELEEGYAGLVVRLRAAAKSSPNPGLLSEAADAIEDLLNGGVLVEEDPRPVG